MIELSSVSAMEETAIASIAAGAGVDLHDCYQCGKCSAGCPMSAEMDYVPRKIIRLLQLGQYEKALNARSPWVCAECSVCSVRCPQEVKVSELMLGVRLAAKAAGICPARDEDVFDDIFIANIRRYGRNNEAMLAGRYNLQTGHFMQDVRNVPKMMARGMIGLKSNRVKDAGAVRALVARALAKGRAAGGEASGSVQGAATQAAAPTAPTAAPATTSTTSTTSTPPAAAAAGATSPAPAKDAPAAAERKEAAK